MSLVGNSEEASVAADRPVHVSGRSERQKYVHVRSVLSCCPDQAALREVVKNSPPKELLVRRKQHNPTEGLSRPLHAPRTYTCSRQKIYGVITACQYCAE